MDENATIWIKSPCEACEGRGYHQMITTRDRIDCHACVGKGVAEEVILPVFLAMLKESITQTDAAAEKAATRIGALEDKTGKALEARLLRIEARLRGLEDRDSRVDDY